MKELFRKFMIVIFTFFVTFTNITPFPVHAADLTNADRNAIITEAKKHLGKPYVWGATGPDSFDCSGYTQYVFKQSINFKLNRTAEQQRVQLIKEGKEISKTDKNKWQPGDLLFFGNYGEAEHVAIWYGNDQVIHAIGDKVQINRFDALIDKNGQKYEIMTVVKTVEDLGGFTILKVDENDKPLSGAVFKITLPNGSSVERTSGKDGKVNFVNVEAGKYKVQEITAPDGKLLDETEKTITVASGWKPEEHVYKFVNNSPTGEISLIKYNDDKSKTLAGTQFHVTSNVGYDEYVTTDTNGKIHLTGLKLGTYTFTETQASNGYLLDSTPVVVKLEYKDQHTEIIYASVEVTNTTPTGEITLTKFNDDKSQVIAGTKFKVTSNVGFEKEVVTDSNGKIHLTGLKLGTYTFVETQASDGYLIDRNPIVIELKYKDQHTSVIYGNVDVTNIPPTGKIILTKYNEDKSSAIANTEYRVTGPNGYNKIHKTNSDGKLIIEGLKLGDYTLVESKASDGYLINKTPIKVSLTYKDQETSVIVGTAEQTNTEPTATVHFKKEDSETGSLPQGDATLKGAVYQLVAAEDIYNKARTHKFYSKGDVVATRITDEKGNMDSVTDLPLGHYQFKEKTASNGYLLDKNVYDVHCDYEGQDVEVVVRNVKSLETVKKQAFQIIKISTDEGGEVIKLPSAEFTVKLTSEVAKIGWDKAKTYNVLTTDEKGYAKSIELPYGTYTVRETKVPDNVMPIEDFTVIIDEDNREPQTWRIMNDAPFKALVKAVKLDKETGKTVLLPDTTFKIHKRD